MDDNEDSIRIEIQIPKKQLVPPPPPPVPDVHIVHNIVNVTTPAPIIQAPSRPPPQIPEPKREPLIKDNSKMQSKDEPGTLEKVRKHGSVLEKTAVHATQKFNYRGITVKDSRAS